jgi:hypothetical protein
VLSRAALIFWCLISSCLGTSVLPMKNLWNYAVLSSRNHHRNPMTYRRRATSRESWLNISAVTVVPGISCAHPRSTLRTSRRYFSGESIVPRFFLHSLARPCSGPFYNRQWYCIFCWLTLLSPQPCPYKLNFSLQSLIPISPLIHHHTLVKWWSFNLHRISS